MSRPNQMSIPNDVAQMLDGATHPMFDVKGRDRKGFVPSSVISKTVVRVNASSLPWKFTSPVISAPLGSG